MKTFPVGYDFPKRKTTIAVAIAVQALALSCGAAAQTVTVNSSAGSTSGTVSGAETNVVFSGAPAAPATATATLVQNASLTGQSGVAVSSTATNTTTQLVLSGGNTIDGSVSGVDNINVQGHDNSAFNGTVQASGTLTLGTTSQLTLDGATQVGKVVFDQGAIVNVANSLTATTIDFQNVAGTIDVANGASLGGTVQSTGGNNGTVVFAGSGSVTGSLGTSSAALSSVVVGSSAAGTVAVQGGVAAGSLQIDNGSTVNVTGGAVAAATSLADGATLSVSGGNMSGGVTTTADGTGTLTLAGGTQTVSGDVGASGAALASVNAGAAGGTTTFTGSVDATNTNVGAGTANFAGLSTGTLGFTGAGTANLSAGMTGDIDFANQAATVSVAEGQTLDGSVRSTGGSNGTLAFVQDGTITGDVGTGATSIAALNVGTAAQGTVTAGGNVYANAVSLQNGSTLALAADKNLTGNVTTTTDGTGTLTLIGGTQTVNGDVGASGAALGFVNAGAAGGTSTFTGSVDATNTNVGAGTANFAGLSTGTLGFTGTGTANLSAGMTGDVDFANQAATVNVAEGQTLDGSVRSTGGSNGTLAFVQDGTVTGDVGTGATSIAALNVGTAAQGTVTAGGNVYANAVSLQNGSTLALAADKNLTGNVTTTMDGTGTLTLSGGAQTVTGNVGASGAALASVNAGAAGATTTFTSSVDANQILAGGDGAVSTFGGATTGNLHFAGNGSVVLNGAGALTGTVDFGNGGAGTLHIGDGVDIALDAAHLTLANAGSATLVFDGNSVVSGPLGTGVTAAAADTVAGSADAGAVPGAIYAGADGKVVTFADTVAVGAGNLNVSGTGEVALQRGLQGGLNFAADGLATVADAQPLSGPVTTSTANTGTLAFAGSSSTEADIGSAAAPLKEIDFNTSGNAATAALNNDLYAATINVGANTAASVTSNLSFGGDLKLAAASTSLDLATSTLTGVSGASAFELGSGTLKTTINGAAYGSVHADTFSNASDAHVVVTVLPSSTVIQNGQKFELVGAATGNTGASTLVAGNVATNSAALTFTAESGSADGSQLGAASGSAGQSLWLVAHRNDYASAAGLAASQPGASALSVLSGIALDPSQLAAPGMATVLGSLDAESAAQLRADAPRLSPLTNGSLSQTAFLAGDAALDSIDTRLVRMRDVTDGADEEPGAAQAQSGRYSVWTKGYGAKASQSGEDGYAGYSATTGGFAIGADTHWNSGGAGLALSQGISSVNENDALDGDTAQVKSYQLTAYGTQRFGRAYLDGVAAVAQQKFSTTRVSAADQVANGSFDGTESIFRLSGGYDIALAPSVLLTPIAAVEADVLHQDGYSENGAGPLDLRVDSQTSSRVRLSLGARLAGQMGGALHVRPELHAFVNEDVGNEDDGVGANYLGGGAAFYTPGYRVPHTSVTVGGGVTLGVTKAIELEVQADVEARSGYTAVIGAVVARGHF